MINGLDPIEVKEKGELLGFGWYRYGGKYLNIQIEKGNEYIRLLADDLIIDKENGYYLAPFKGGVPGTVIFIRGYEMIKPDIYYKDVQVLRNGFYVIKTPGNNTLNYIGRDFNGFDDTVFKAERIYHIKQVDLAVPDSYKYDLYIAISDGSKYAIKVNSSGVVIDQIVIVNDFEINDDNVGGFYFKGEHKKLCRVSDDNVILDLRE